MDKVGDQVTVCVANEIVKLMLEEVAAAKVDPALIDAVSEQVPAETNATRPVEEFSVQIDEVELA